MYELEIRAPSNLLSIVLRREITPAQASIIKLVIDSDITYGEALAVFTPWFNRDDEITREGRAIAQGGLF